MPSIDEIYCHNCGTFIGSLKDAANIKPNKAMGDKLWCMTCVNNLKSAPIAKARLKLPAMGFKIPAGEVLCGPCNQPTSGGRYCGSVGCPMYSPRSGAKRNYCTVCDHTLSRGRCRNLDCVLYKDNG